MQGCAFWGSRWWIITFSSPKFPKTPILGAWIGISSQICKKIQIAISSDLCIRLTWNLTGSCGQQQRLRGWSRMVVKQFEDGGRPPFWKSLYSHISVKSYQILMQFCTQQQILNWMNVTWSKMKKLHWTDFRVRQNAFLVYWYTAEADMSSREANSTYMYEALRHQHKKYARTHRNCPPPLRF